MSRFRVDFQISSDVERFLSDTGQLPNTRMLGSDCTTYHLFPRGGSQMAFLLECSSQCDYHSEIFLWYSFVVPDVADHAGYFNCTVDYFDVAFHHCLYD